MRRAMDSKIVTPALHVIEARSNCWPVRQKAHPRSSSIVASAMPKNSATPAVSAAHSFCAVSRHSTWCLLLLLLLRGGGRCCRLFAAAAAAAATSGSATTKLRPTTHAARAADQEEEHVLVVVLEQLRRGDGRVARARERGELCARDRCQRGQRRRPRGHRAGESASQQELHVRVAWRRSRLVLWAAVARRAAKQKKTARPRSRTEVWPPKHTERVLRAQDAALSLQQSTSFRLLP